MRYEKGRKENSRQRILEVATDRFRGEGIAASGLAAIMSDAGLTNGAFYPHFGSKAELVRESVKSALDGQAEQIRQLVAAGGLDGALAAYLSKEHRDHPAQGCTSAALLPEIARQPAETRALYADRLLGIARPIMDALPAGSRDRQGTALAILATAIGTLQLARAVDGGTEGGEGPDGPSLSDRILAAGLAAARTLAAQGAA